MSMIDESDSAMRRCFGCERMAFEPKPEFAFGPEYCEECFGILAEQAISEQQVVNESHAIECPRCEIELGAGKNRCHRAKGSDLCMDCALDMDGVAIDDDYSGDEPGNTFRNADYPFVDNF